MFITNVRQISKWCRTIALIVFSDLASSFSLAKRKLSPSSCVKTDILFGSQATDNNIIRTSHKGKCAFTEGGVKCGAKTLPVTKYCRKHILEVRDSVINLNFANY